MSAVIKHNNFDSLIQNISNAHQVLQESAIQSVNQHLTLRNWLFGCYIVEYEQSGEDRAKYGENLLESIAKELKQKAMKGLNRRTLNNCRTFYFAYPQIWQTLSAKLQLPDNKENTILRTLSSKSQNENIAITITNAFKNWGTLTPKFDDEHILQPDLLLSKLSFSHFIELIRISDPVKRLFYEVETIKNNWSVRELKRAMDSALAERTALSTDKKAIIAKIQNIKPATNAEIIRNPYILEFLNLEEKAEYSESDLEQSILSHLQKFLVELGTGFCFEARQKRITFNNKHYRIDLVFYHRVLKCHILIDLKLGEYDHADAGQMTLYLNYFKENEMTEGDNPPIGLILCADKDDTLVKYTTAGMDDKLFVSQYLLKLPDSKLLENFIKKELDR
ncbi:MAG: PDDEXK nuclease domain-containing protein [Prevotellaceae bacterium]|jgi:predicted nuclease of restriction endonuclease-like (RecB) superfamily|nr:PDDEXK nuclease domain-containing protein [Prevotellaceae bacterium]